MPKMTVSERDIYQTCESSQCLPTSLRWLESKSGYELGTIKGCLGSLSSSGHITITETGIGAKPIRIKCHIKDDADQDINNRKAAGAKNAGTTKTGKLLAEVVKYPDGIYRTDLIDAVAGSGATKGAKDKWANLINACINDGKLYTKLIKAGDLPMEERYSFHPEKLEGLRPMYHTVLHELRDCRLTGDLNDRLKGKYTEYDIIVAMREIKKLGAIVPTRKGTRFSMVFASCYKSLAGYNDELSMMDRAVYSYLMGKYGMYTPFLFRSAHLSAAIGCSRGESQKAIASLTKIGVLQLTEDNGRFRFSKYQLTKVA